MPAEYRISRRAMVGAALAGLIMGDVSAATPEPITEMTILLIGADAREGQAIEQANADILIAAQIEVDGPSVRMLNVLRDTRVEIPDIGFTKITHTLAIGGIPHVRSTVEDFLGVGMDRHVAIDYLTAAALIDGLGGVTVMNDVAFSIQDVTIPAGEVHLSGHEAMLFARFRGDDEGDLGRVKRQQQIFAALLLQIRQADPGTLMSAAGPLLGQGILTDMELADLLTLFNRVGRRISAEDVSHDVVPWVSTGMMFDDYYEQQLWMGESDPAVVAEKAAWLINGDG